MMRAPFVQDSSNHTPSTASVQMLPGVGEDRARQLARLEIRTIKDLLLHRPRRYEDRRNYRSISELKSGSTGVIRAEVVTIGRKGSAKRAKSAVEMIVDDRSGRLHCRWWNQPYRQRAFQPQQSVLVFGKVTRAKPLTMDHPEVEVIDLEEGSPLHVDRIVPIYPLTEGITQRWLRSLIATALDTYGDALQSEPGDSLLTGRPTHAEAIHSLHFPKELTDTDQARERLAMDEFLAIQLELQRRRRRLRDATPGLRCLGDNRLVRPLLTQLGFSLTHSQTEALKEIRRDLGRNVPMRRLLQGDVGSGKTVVAACAAAITLESGHNAAFLVPTEVLAEQHDATFRRWLAPLGVSVSLCTASRPISEPDTARPHIVIGTHALLASQVTLPTLGLTIIDEQHKFGVTQRERLVKKGHHPHLLVMTATPIPRTLALTLHGDLDISVIKRTHQKQDPIRTFVRAPHHLPKVWQFLRQQLDQGRQAYIVYPRIDEDDSGNLQTLDQAAGQLATELDPHRIAVLHGRLKAADREKAMTDFQDNRIQALVTTTVIEVGLDIPNATVMVIENADRFGLAQLHQLRGRIGRGPHQSYCILIRRSHTKQACSRLQALVAHNDGFQIADSDLRLRGPGELLGQGQSGLPNLRFGDLLNDGPLMDQAKQLAKDFVQQNEEE